MVTWYCSPDHHGLLSNDPSTFKASLEYLLQLFHHMQEYNLGRVCGSGRAVGFQKKHAAYLSTFAVNLVTKEWRLPIWIFGGYLPTSFSALPT